MRRLIIKLIRGYKYAISPMFAQSCRFTPSCSQYACEAIQKHGVIAGGWLSIKRLLRCNPFSSGGFDPIP